MLKIELEIEDLVGCTILRDNYVMKWEKLTHQEQIRVINALGNFYALFYKHFKEKENDSN